MKKLILLSIFAIFLVGCGEEKNFEVPALTGRVVDTAHVLSGEEKTEIENAILNFEKNTQGQFAVCIVPNIRGETIETASMKVAERWKIGKRGEDNGIILLLSMREREFRIEVAYGFEGKLNDAKAADEHRLWQARQLITYEFQTVESKEPEQVYFSLPSQRTKPDGGYTSIEVIRQDPQMMEELKKEAARELHRVNEKYRKIEELGAVRKVSESFIRRYFPSFQVSANSGV